MVLLLAAPSRVLRLRWRWSGLLTECVGQFNMLVSYTYRSDDPEPSEEPGVGTPSRSHATNKAPEMKNFSFYTVVDLGTIMYREEPRLSAEL